MILAMFSNFSREIVKDMEDIEGDKKAFLKRLTSGFKASIAERFGITTKGVNIKYKRKWILILAGLSLMVAIIISPIPYLLNILGWSYLILVTITDVVFIFCIYKLSSSTGKKQFSDISKKIKIGMLFGLLAFIIGILI
jgi:geranylgeranylglycerol-phosphate geranylgeranyltransferase